ncbi:HAMP domain-containing sensor histidine kinase [Sphingosinicella sp. CPCC 101087]|uniref:sensor histidine kinase n=1 Tax=Sphingosinicella sp. CPCC 101087 TaxID=2497754 RepID=UPI00101CBEE7|nr:HAMP domain-containing sensor histidine kinase [Sphingosinicella sp. CPCC 101087]
MIAAQAWIGAARAWIRRHWPRLRLRTILLATLLFVAALPGLGAVFLRVYENTLVRQTEAELVAQGAALAAAATALWPGTRPAQIPDPADLRPEPPRIDLNATPILPERPAPTIQTRRDPAAEAAARRLAPILAYTRRTTLASILLLDRDGNVLLPSEFLGSHAALPEVRAALAGRPETVLRRNGDYRQVYRFEWLTRAAAIRVHHARPIVVDGRVVGVLLLSRSARALFRGMYEDRGKIAIGVVAIFAILVVLTALLSRGISRPIERLSEATRAVAQGRGEVPDPPPTAAIEIQALYADFGAMAAAIDRRSRYLRDFAHSVSHEFKTPLAGIRGAIELLQDHYTTMDEAERRQFLANAAADADRLAHLLSRLLDLAKADMARPGNEATAPVDATAHRIADAHRADGFAVDVSLPPAMPPAMVPERVLEAALTSLIENSRQAGATRVSITGRENGPRIEVDVLDDGPGIRPADRERIFEPFFTGRRAEGGTGLGLPIVKSLLAGSHAKIDLVASDRGALFRLNLPRSDKVGG